MPNSTGFSLRLRQGTLWFKMHVYNYRGWIEAPSGPGRGSVMANGQIIRTGAYSFGLNIVSLEEQARWQELQTEPMRLFAVESSGAILFRNFISERK